MPLPPAILSCQDALLLETRTSHRDEVDKMAREMKGMQATQGLTRQKIEKYRKENERHMLIREQSEKEVRQLWRV